MLSGVIEGFYGRAWTTAQRLEMMDWIADAGMNTFVYGPKDDIKVRARWREVYDEGEVAGLVPLIARAQERGLNFVVAIAPSLDITHSDPRELETLKRRVDQLIGLGVRHFTLLFDDIPRTMKPEDAAAFPSLAAAQSHVANAVFDDLRSKVADAILIFCPTEYCAAFAGHDVPGSDYLNALGERLNGRIGVFWTGPEIVSETISAESLAEVGKVLRRKPIIWDNFHANDYDIRRVYAGPLGGRGPEILDLIEGIITNPNNEFEANFVAIRTTGDVARGVTDEDAIFAAALDAWRPRFQLAFRPRGETVAPEHIRLLAELHHQPFRCGPEIETLLATARQLLVERRPDTRSSEWRAGHARIVALRDRVRALFEEMTELENRDLFYAFHAYLWEAREEVTHLVTYLDWLAESPAPESEFPEAERVYNFYRRGFTVDVQALLPRVNGRMRHGA
jgi:protein O-GlcNAcase/histone acetyltransferase